MAHRPSITQTISWVYTHDLDCSCRFYTQTLGFKLVKDEGVALIFAVVGGAFIGVCLASGDRVVEPKGGLISIVTDEVDAWYHRLVKAGVSCRNRPKVLETFNVYAFFAEDPDGYLIEFQQFL